MGKYASAQNTALALIAKKGGPVTLKRAVPGTFDPITQARVGATTTSVTYQAVVLPPSGQTKYQAGTLEISVSFEAYFALKGQTVIPTVGDVVTVSGTDYKVAYVDVTDPAQDGPILAKAFLEA